MMLRVIGWLGLGERCFIWLGGLGSDRKAWICGVVVNGADGNIIVGTMQQSQNATPAT